MCVGLLTYLACTEAVLLLSAEPAFACGDVFRPADVVWTVRDWFGWRFCRIALSVDGGVWVDLVPRLYGRLEEVVLGLCARATLIASAASAAAYASGFIEGSLWSAAGANTCLSGLLYFRASRAVFGYLQLKRGIANQHTRPIRPLIVTLLLPPIRQI